MAINNVLAGVAVNDLATGVAWYSRILGRAPDKRPMAEVAEWKFPGGGCLQVFRDARRAGSSSVTFAVANLEDELRRLDIRLTINETPKVRTVIINDPDHNQVVLAQAIGDQVSS